MKAKRGLKLVLASLVVALIGASGCSRMPITPQSYEEPNPRFVAVPARADSVTANPTSPAPVGSIDDPGEVPSVRHDSDPHDEVATPSASLLPVPVADPTGPLSNSGTIDGDAGGTLAVGRFTLIVPAGAWKGSATVGIAVKDQTLLQCDLSISPASANHFARPVMLVSSYEGANLKNPASLITVWYDEDAKLWREVPGSESYVGARQVKAPLWHFSSYGVTDGRAGW